MVGDMGMKERKSEGGEKEACSAGNVLAGQVGINGTFCND